MQLNMCWYRLCCLWLQNSDCLLLPQISMLVSGLSGRSRSIYPVWAPAWEGTKCFKRLFSHGVHLSLQVRSWSSPQTHIYKCSPHPGTKYHKFLTVSFSMLGRILWIFCCCHVQADIRHGTSVRECTLVGWFSQQILYLVFKYTQTL